MARVNFLRVLAGLAAVSFSALCWGLLFALFLSPAIVQAAEVKPGAVCTLQGAWYSATIQDPAPSRPEAVRVVLLAPMPTTTEPGAWVQPVAGPYSGLQFHIKAERLKECKA